MAGFDFQKIPQIVPRVETRHRRMVTAFPVPESLPILADLDRYESRSMHGQMPVVWDKAEGYQVWDRWGNCWIDFTSTIFVANAGHSNPAIVAALKAQLEQKLLHTYTYPSEIRARYLKRLIEAMPPYLEKAFLLSAGTEATECALKLMRMAGHKRGKRKGGIVAFESNWHGRTMGSQFLCGNESQKEWIGWHDPAIWHVPFPYSWKHADPALDRLDGRAWFQRSLDSLRSRGIDPTLDLCGFMIESYQGWSAAMYPPGYIQSLAEFARAHGILVTVDEVQAGFGRTGKLFTYMHYDLEPDLVCCGKGMSSSLPLSAVLGRAEFLDLPDIGSMSSTHSANPMSCAAGLANLETLLEGDLVRESERKGLILFERLHDLRKRFMPHIGYVWGKGLLASIIFGEPGLGKVDAHLPSIICEKAMQKGLLLVHTGRESIKIGPPLTISDEALMEGLDVLEESFSECIPA